MAIRSSRKFLFIAGAFSAAIQMTISLSSSASAQIAAPIDWPQFRGIGASGKSNVKGLPLNWSDDRGIAWKTPMPGPGASSPIVLGNRIFITCHSGYADGSKSAGDLTQLKRHVLSLDLADGKILWNTAVAAELPEQERIREDHGYASSTPVVDADRIYAFFGKSGVIALDHQGKELWRTQVGSTLNGWGSATSPVLYKDWVIVNASIESESLVALDKKTGHEVWRVGGIKESWHAPAIVTTPEGKTEIVVAMFRKLAAFDPENGQSLWHADTGINWYMCPTPLVEAGVVYAIGGRNPNGALAVRSGGRGDVTSSHMVWKLNKGSNVPSPLLHEGHLYFAHENLGIVYCVNAKSGELIYEERLQPSPGQIYASPVLADGKIFYIGRGGRAVVVAAKPVFEKLAENTLEGNRGVFNASPAVGGNRLLLRSNRALYAIGGN